MKEIRRITMICEADGENEEFETRLQQYKAKGYKEIRGWGSEGGYRETELEKRFEK